MGTEGRVDGPGDTKRCVYESGHLVKRITDYQPGEPFGFDVIEQVGIEDRSAELHWGRAVSGKRSQSRRRWAWRKCAIEALKPGVFTRSHRLV